MIVCLLKGILKYCLQVFTNSLILSDDAKRFAVAREIERGKTDGYRWNGVIMPVHIAITYLLCRLGNRKAMLFRRAPIYRLAMYQLVGGIMAFSAVFMKDVIKYNLESVLDNKACNLGIGYARGGVEYYDKQLKNHIALRTLMPDNKGQKLYNLKGDTWTSLFRPYKQTPITQRKEECMKILKDLDNNAQI